MDYENKEHPQGEEWIDEILMDPHNGEEIGPDEHAVQSAGLIHPDDMELEMILAEHRETEENQWENIPLDTLPTEEEEQPYNDEIQAVAEAEVSQFFSQQEEEPAPAAEEEAALFAPIAPVPEEPVPEQIPEAPEEELPPRKGRPARKKGYGLLGIPHLAATLIWLILIVLIGVSLGRTLWLCCADLMAFDKTDKEAVVTIADDDTIDTISQKLAQQGLIRYPGLFKTFAELTGKYENISTGTFTLNSRLDYNALINSMTYYGPSREVVEVMFPEGYTCAQIFALLEEKGVCTVAELEEYAANGELEEFWFLEGVTRGDKYCLEGYLFPDTYEFYTNDDPGRVLEKFLYAFDYRFTDLMKERLANINESFAQRLADEGFSQDYIDSHTITIREVVIIASLIEKETAGGEESYDISSVIYNRLSNSAEPPYLGIDAALIYGLGGNIDPETGKTKPLTDSDKALDNPYNTYKYAGLTPGPISNPGQSSLDAAVNPNSTSYYYYALDPSTGLHKFSKTYAEHLQFLESIGW